MNENLASPIGCSGAALIGPKDAREELLVVPSLRYSHEFEVPAFRERNRCHRYQMRWFAILLINYGTSRVDKTLPS